jgi:TetR/AcrR family transcriptional regulator
MAIIKEGANQSAKQGEKKLHILQVLASMLENPKEEKITTAALAARIGVSEAALYRHFASKAQMFEGLIEFIENTVFGLINQINMQQANGLKQTQEIVSMLLSFSSRNPGMTKVMTGHALINEDERLQLRMNQFVDRIELAIKQALRVAVLDGQMKESEVALRANLIVSVLLGRWQRFVKTAFQHDPLENSSQQIALLLS